MIASHSAPPGSTKQNFSPWLFLDAAHVLFQTAKSRVYTGQIDSRDLHLSSTSMPSTLQPVLEEQPKWAVLAEVLDEIERDTYLNPTPQDGSSSAILIMCGDQQTCRQIRQYLQTMRTAVEEPSAKDDEGSEIPDYKGDEPSGVFMLRRKLKDYLYWKRYFAKVNNSLFATKPKDESAGNKPQSVSSNIHGRAPANKRRRVRGGSSSASSSSRAPDSSVQVNVEETMQESTLLEEIQAGAPEDNQPETIVIDDLEDMDNYYELYDMNDLLMIHSYDGDMDEHILEEVKPRYIIMYEPDAAFIRRVEVYRSSHTDRNVKVYFLYYGGSVEEQRYLSAVRREKDAFTKLIREKGVSSNARFLGQSITNFT